MFKNLPDTAVINRAGHLEIGGCDIVEIAKKYGTPLYIIDETTLRDRCRQYIEAFQANYHNSEIVFASKALCVKGICRVIANEGLGFDVSSGGELFTVLKAGADAKKIYFHGNNKSSQEIEEGLKAKVGRFVIDNEQELVKIDLLAGKLRTKAQVLVRVNPGIEAHTHEFIQTGKIDSKFGVPFEQLDRFVTLIRRSPNIALKGFHAHIGSQIFDIKPFVEETRLLLDLTLKYGTEEIDIGGGLGIAYLNDQDPPAIADLAREITAVLKGKTQAKLILEPGRSIVGTAGVTVYSIGVIKDIPGIRKYVIVDGGMSDNPRPILYDAKYDALLSNKATAKPEEKVTVAGRFCESGDILIRDIVLPKIEPGDLLTVMCTGAYNYAMASNYNRVVKPAMVMLKAGKAKLLLKRESYKDLIINDAD